MPTLGTNSDWPVDAADLDQAVEQAARPGRRQHPERDADGDRDQQ